MPDRFSNNAASLSGPASHAFPITPSDTVDLTEAVRALYVGSGGAISLRTISGSQVTFLPFPRGASCRCGQIAYCRPAQRPPILSVWSEEKTGPPCFGTAVQPSRFVTIRNSLAPSDVTTWHRRLSEI